MSFDGLIKRTVYWANDFIHGSKVRKHFNQIKKVMSDKKYGITVQQENLKRILKHAAEHTEFYKPYKGKTLFEFPVVNKSILLENYAANTVNIKHIPEQETEVVHIQKTSGSTGTPFAVFQDSRKRYRRIAELKYFGEMVGYKSHERLAQCRIWTNWQSKTKKQIFKENIFPIDVSYMDDNTMNNLCEVVRKNKITAVRAYASWYDSLLRYFESGTGDISSFKTIKVMFSTSEALNSETKMVFKSKYNIPIVECYADEEAGIMAHQYIDSDVYFLNNAGYYFELLKLDEDKPAEYGEIGRIVITDLFNYAFPLIRYDTGDTAVFEKGNSKSGGWDYMKQLYGRRLDMVYDINGQPLHPMCFARVLKNLSGIVQWQFIQESEKTYVVKIIASDGFNENSTLNEIRNIVGQKADILIEYVDDMPVLASGKRKAVICEWTDKK